MKRLYFLIFLTVMLTVSGGKAQTLYSDPSPLQESSQDVKIFFNAASTPLAGQPATASLYAHTGCNLSNGTEWFGAPDWNKNQDKYKLTYVSENLWQLYIGDIRTFYNVPAGTNVTSLNFVFRNSGGTTQTDDLFLTVYDEGLQLNLAYNTIGTVITGETSYITFTVSTTIAADITLDVNGTTVGSASNATSLEQSYTFTEPGDYTVTATAKANGETVSESVKFTYLSSSVEMNYPGGTPKMGPVANPDGSVTFCIGAPEKKHVVLVGSWNDYAFNAGQVMNYQDTPSGRYFWTTVSGLDPNKMYVYYYVIDGGEYTVGDPYARLVLDPWNDKYIDTNVFPGLPEYPTDALKGQMVPVAIYQGNINEYNWKIQDFKGADPSNLIIYELLFRDFTGTEGKALGNGTVRQAIEKFQYLIDLGVNAIELLPIMEFNDNQSWGYNPNFYFAVDKAYGTPDDYKEFIDLCHQNGIAVILDMVFNQSDGLHPWYQMYSSMANPFYNLPADGYGGENGAPHAYSVLNDWNQGVPMVQEQWKDVIEYWMNEYKFDGFRFDLVKGLGLNESYKSASDVNTNAYNASRVAEMQYLQSVILDINPNGYCINENLAGSKEENEMAATGMLNWANVNDPGCQFAMGYPSGSDLNRMYAPDYTTYVSSSTSSATGGRTWGSTVSYLESHDEQRLAYKQDQWGVAGVKGNVSASMQRLGSAAAQMILTPGAHMIWMFSEMGNAENTKNSDGGNNVDPKIVNWNLLENPYHYGLYENYCHLISIRNENPELFAEDATFTNNCGENNWNNGRWLYSVSADKEKELYTIINPNFKEGQNLTVSNVPFLNKDNAAYHIVALSYGSNPTFDAVNGTVTVPANCFVSIASQSATAAVEDVTESSSSLQVRGEYGVIVIDYSEAEVEIYSMEGMLIGKGTSGHKFTATPGLYVAKSGKASQKVIVK